MKKIILVSLIFIFACATNNYNTPFINVDETKQFEFGMSPDEVLKKIGYPLFVASGGNGEVVWVYEVRTISVLSNVTPADVQPNKANSQFKNDPPIHKLAVVFRNDELKSWGKYNPESNEEEEKEEEKEESSNSEYMINGTLTVKEKE